MKIVFLAFNNTTYDLDACDFNEVTTQLFDYLEEYHDEFMEDGVFIFLALAKIDELTISFLDTISSKVLGYFIYIDPNYKMDAIEDNVLLFAEREPSNVISCKLIPRGLLSHNELKRHGAIEAKKWEHGYYLSVDTLKANTLIIKK